MLVCGQWVAQLRTESPAVIMDEYLDKAVPLARAHAPAHLGEAYHTLAVFADEQYEATRANMESATWESAQQLRAEARAELEQWRASYRELRAGDAHRADLDKHIKRTEKELLLEEERVKAADDHKARFRTQAVTNYLLSLQHGDSHDAQAFRVTSLWVDNCTEPEIHVAMATHLPHIQPHKFLPLVYQLAARIDARPAPALKAFHTLLNDLLVRVWNRHSHALRLWTN